MLNLLRSLLLAGLAFVRTRRQLAVEILALRHQLGVPRRSVKRPRLSNVDRGLWVLLSRRWSSWSDALIIVKPETVIKHRAGFRTRPPAAALDRGWAWARMQFLGPTCALVPLRSASDPWEPRGGR